MDPHKNTLLTAIKIGDLTFVTHFLDKGGDVNTIISSYNDNLIYYACHYQKLEIVKCLVERGANLHAINYSGYTPLHIACTKPSLPIIQYLIEAGAPLCAYTSRGRNAFNLACIYSSREIAFYLGTLMMEKGIDIHSQNKDGFTPLHDACTNGRFKIVKMLIELGADPYILTPEGENAFNIACKYDKKEIVEYLGNVMLLN